MKAPDCVRIPRKDIIKLQQKLKIPFLACIGLLKEHKTYEGVMAFFHEHRRQPTSEEHTTPHQ